MKYAFLFSLVAVVFFAIGCTQDPCTKNKIECKNGGACSDGTCICAYAFEGSFCENRITRPFAGLYTGTETDTAATNHRLKVTESLVAADKIDFTIVDSARLFAPYSASVRHDGSFTIADQLLLDTTNHIRVKSDTLYVSGEGQRTDKMLNYTLYYSPVLDSIRNHPKTRRVTGVVSR